MALRAPTGNEPAWRDPPPADRAPPVIRLAGDGSPLLGIEDHRGCSQDYRLSPAVAEPGGWACMLARADGEGDGPHRVEESGGRWRCGCDGWRYRGACKHVRALRPLRALLAGFGSGKGA